MVSENYIDPSSQRTDSSQLPDYQRHLLPEGTSPLTDPQLEKLSVVGKKVASRIDKFRLIFSGAQSKKRFYITKGYQHLTHVSPEFIKNNFPLYPPSKQSRYSPAPAQSITQSEALHFNRLFKIQNKVDKSAFKDKLNTALGKSSEKDLLDKIDLILEIEEKLDERLISQDHLTPEDLKKAKQLILKSALKINLNQLSKIDKRTLSSTKDQMNGGLHGKALARYEEILKNPQAYESKIQSKEAKEIKEVINGIGNKFKELYTSRYPNITVEDWNEFNDFSNREKIENLVGDPLLNSMSRKIKEQFLTNMEQIYNEAGENDEALASALTKYMRCHKDLEAYDSNPEFTGDKQHLFLLQLPFKKGITIEFNKDLTQLYESYKTKGTELTKALKAKFEIQNSEIPLEAEIPKRSQQVYQFIKKGYSDYGQYAQRMYQSLEKALTNKDNADFSQFTQHEMLEGYEQAAQALKEVVDATEIPQSTFHQGVNIVGRSVKHMITVTYKNKVKTIGRNFFQGKFSIKTKEKPSKQTNENSKTSTTKKNDSVIFNKKLDASKVYETYNQISLEGQIKTTTDLSKFAEEIKTPEASLKFIRGLCQAYSGQQLSEEQIEALNAHASLFSIPELPEKIIDKLKMISPAVNLLKKNHGEIVNLISALISSLADEAEQARLNPKDKTNLFINFFQSALDVKKEKVLEKAAEEETGLAAAESAESVKTESTDDMSDLSSASDAQIPVSGHESLQSQKSDKTDTSKIKKSPKLFELPNITSFTLGMGGALVSMVLNSFKDTISSTLVGVISSKLYPAPDVPSVKELKELFKECKADPIQIGKLYNLLPEFNALLPEDERVQLTVGDQKDAEKCLMTAAKKVKTQLKAKRKSLTIALKPLIQPIFNRFLETHKTQDLFKYIIPIYTKLSEVDCDDVKKQEELYSALADFCGYVLHEASKEKELIENIFSLLEEMSQKPLEVK